MATSRAGQRRQPRPCPTDGRASAGLAGRSAAKAVPRPPRLPAHGGDRAAGTLCGQAGTPDVIDAMVVVLAAQLDAAVVTSDPDDLADLSLALGHKLA